MKTKRYVIKHRSAITLIGYLLMICAFTLSLLTNMILFANRDNVNAEQIKQIAYGRFVKGCLELSTDKRTNCEDIKVDTPEWYSSRDGEGWIVDSACFTPTGKAADCMYFQPTND